MAESRMAIVLPPVQPGWHSLTVDTHAHTLQAAVSTHGFLLYIPHPRFLARSLMRSALRMKNRFFVALYPLHPLIALSLVLITALYVVFAPRESWVRSGPVAEFLWEIDEHIPFTNLFPLSYRLSYLSAIASLSVILVFVMIQRLFLRLLLHYKGWVFDPPSAPSLLTRVWAAALTYLYLRRGKLLLYSFQQALPRLPVPPLRQSVEKFLRSVKPLLSEEKYKEIEKESVVFLDHQGPKLQRYLQLRSWITSNYISEWWLRFIYLRGRSPIYINSNYYAIPSELPPSLFSRNQIARAANIIHLWLKLKRKIDSDQLQPIVANVHPLCMQQYSLMFSTTRVPQREEDQLVHYDSADSRHIIVFYKGAYYRLMAYTQTGSLLTPYELQVLLQHLVDDREKKGGKEKISLGEANIAALTTLPRSRWAEIREEHFNFGINHYGLNQIERAIFAVCLDDESPQSLEQLCFALFCGNGGNRWCDKSLTHIIFANGLSGMNVEHSWADAPVVSHSSEITTWGEMSLKNFGEDGLLLPPSKPIDPSTLPMPQRLRFHLTEELEMCVVEALHSAQEAASNLDLVLYQSKFGKNSFKKCRMSPDSFVQMTLQLAYYRSVGSFALTYESAMMRFFRDGRTETIRSLSEESVAFVLAMENGSASKEEKKALHRKAVDAHNHYAKMASIGEGVDRHLFALYVVAMGTETEAKFLREALQIPWKLSTSQIPHRMYDGWPKDDNRGDNPLYRGVGGGFGPVADDGYGVCYIFAGESHTNFHISSKKSCKETDSSKFRQNLERAFQDILSLYEN